MLSDSAQAKSEDSSPGFLSNFKTTGVKNIEAAYSRAGATNNHTPGHASQLGSQDQEGGGKHGQGIGSEDFSEGFGDQKAEPPQIGKIFNNIMNGTDNKK